jgi:2'-5' RNA ligase
MANFLSVGGLGFHGDGFFKEYHDSSKMTKNPYDRVWTNFTQLPRISRAPRGKGTGLVLLIWIQDHRIRDKITQLQTIIADRHPIDLIPLNALHITVRDMGTITHHQQDNQIHPDKLPQIQKQLGKILPNLASFKADLERVNSFSICPFIEVHDNGAVNSIRDAIQPGLTDLGIPIDRPTGYLPHLSLGYYTKPEDRTRIQEALSGIREQRIGRIEVTKLSLIKAPWSKGMYRLELIQEFSLGR